MKRAEEGSSRGGAGDAREVALRVLLEYDRRNAYLNALLETALSRSLLDRRDRAFATEIIQGTVRMKQALDWTLSAYSSRKLEELDRELLWALRVSAYQVMYMSVPDHAACNTGVGLAKKLLGRAAAAYANGVLRALANGWRSTGWPDRSEDPAEHLAVRHSHPRWLVDQWIEDMGHSAAEALCAADNTPPKLSIRCNLNRTCRDAVMDSLSEGGAEVTPSAMVPEGVLVRGMGGFTRMEGFGKGLYSAQDEASMLVGHALSVRPGMRVLDMCSAPGGKANHAAELMGNRGEVIALDLNCSRLRTVDESARRLGNTAIATIEADARNAGEFLDGRFDRVLVDAPCTGLGTLARRPDVRWRRRPEQVEELSALQSELLAAGAAMLKPGGLIVYSVCTITEAESCRVVNGFLGRDKGFVVVGGIPGVSAGTRERFTRTFPDRHGCDGMFIARLLKVP